MHIWGRTHSEEIKISPSGRSLRTACTSAPRCISVPSTLTGCTPRCHQKSGSRDCGTYWRRGCHLPDPGCHRNHEKDRIWLKRLQFGSGAMRSGGRERWLREVLAAETACWEQTPTKITLGEWQEHITTTPCYCTTGGTLPSTILERSREKHYLKLSEVLVGCGQLWPTETLCFFGRGSTRRTSLSRAPCYNEGGWAT